MQIIKNGSRNSKASPGRKHEKNTPPNKLKHECSTHAPEETEHFNIQRSCLRELKLFSQSNELSLLGFRQPTEEQYAQSREVKDKIRKSQ